MKRYSILAIVLVIGLMCYGFSCFTSSSCKVKKYDSIVITQENYCKEFTNNEPIWIANISKKGVEYLLRGDSVSYCKNDITKFINALNRHHRVKIKLDSIKNGIAYTTIINNTFFTQNLGSTDANWYVASVVFTLTETEGIKQIYLNYAQGDYGGEPGLMDKDSIKAKFKICPWQ